MQISRSVFFVTALACLAFSSEGAKRFAQGIIHKTSVKNSMVPPVNSSNAPKIGDERQIKEEKEVQTAPLNLTPDLSQYLGDLKAQISAFESGTVSVGKPKDEIDRLRGLIDEKFDNLIQTIGAEKNELIQRLILAEEKINN